MAALRFASLGAATAPIILCVASIAEISCSWADDCSTRALYVQASFTVERSCQRSEVILNAGSCLCDGQATGSVQGPVDLGAIGLDRGWDSVGLLILTHSGGTAFELRDCLLECTYTVNGVDLMSSAQIPACGDDASDGEDGENLVEVPFLVTCEE